MVGAEDSRRLARGRRRIPCEGRRGLTLLELTVVMSVLLVAFLGMSQAISSSMAVTEMNRETALATDAGREMLEVLDGDEDFATVFARYNAVSSDDGGVATPGSGFAVAGLRPAEDDTDGLVGEIVFPVDGTGAGLLESPGGDTTWGEVDIDGDGGIDLLPVTDYRLLPVLVRVRWVGGRGEQVMELRTLLADR